MKKVIIILLIFGCSSFCYSQTNNKPLSELIDFILLIEECDSFIEMAWKNRYNSPAVNGLLKEDIMPRIQIIMKTDTKLLLENVNNEVKVGRLSNDQANSIKDDFFSAWKQWKDNWDKLYAFLRG